MMRCLNFYGHSLVVQKEGPNKGRPFYACPQPRDQGCGFFQWGDEDSGSGGKMVTGNDWVVIILLSQF